MDASSGSRAKGPAAGGVKSANSLRGRGAGRGPPLTIVQDVAIYGHVLRPQSHRFGRIDPFTDFQAILGLRPHPASNYNSPQLVLAVAREDWVAVWARIPGYRQCQQIGLQIVLNGGYP